jgi:uncharacterized protein (TIGR02266 family)
VSSNAPIRIRLRYAAFDTFIEKFAPNVTRGGVFLASRTPPPVGTTFAFEIQLAGGEVALAGDGKVVWVKPYDPAAPQKAHGMGVQFLRLDEPSRQTLNQMLARKGSGQSSGVVRTTAPNVPSGPIRTGLNGAAAPAARVDTSVDLAAEFGLDDARLRRAVDRARLGASRASAELEELEALLRKDPAESVSLVQALAEMPRMLDPRGRRMSGAFRPLSELGPTPFGATTFGPSRTVEPAAVPEPLPVESTVPTADPEHR